MADLDDFFAKKDRKKKGTVKKFATPEELAKVIEDTTKKATEVKPRKVTPVVGSSSSSSGDGGGTEGSDQKAAPEPVVEEEWKEFEEERKDYSGLKLTQLNITEEEYQQGHYGGDDGGATPRENDGDRTGADSAERKAGAAWKKPGADGADQQQEQSAAAALAAAPRAASSLYVSPAMKNLRIKGKKGVAPDLKNEEFFPTLGTEQPDPTKSKKDGTFEEVKHGGRVRPSDMPSAAPLSVGNRFTTLSNDS
uniref:Protein CDV3 homolog n=1 Tax=Culex tarsalis TaxID=7177 RepID=A0A1Q3F0B0_CULTA